MKFSLLRLGQVILVFIASLAAGAMTQSLLGGLSHGSQASLMCGPYERGGSIYRIGSTEGKAEKCTWIVHASQ